MNCSAKTALLLKKWFSQLPPEKVQNREPAGTSHKTRPVSVMRIPAIISGFANSCIRNLKGNRIRPDQAARLKKEKGPLSCNLMS